MLDATGKVHGIIPTTVPDNWTRGQLEQLVNDLEASLGNRQREQQLLGEDSRHRDRMREERDFLRQIQKKLSGS